MCPPDSAQFHGLPTNWNVLILCWFWAKATESALKDLSSLGAAAQHIITHSSPSLSPSLTHHPRPHCFLQSLLTGLMYHRPDDPIDYLESCLKKVRELGGTDKVRWDTFVGQEKKSLPPLNGGQSRRSIFRNGEQWEQDIFYSMSRTNCFVVHRPIVELPVERPRLTRRWSGCSQFSVCPSGSAAEAKMLKQSPSSHSNPQK